MKSKILKLSTVVLLLLFIGASCLKDEWEEIELTSDSCSDLITDVVVLITDKEGIITNYGSGTEYFILAEGIQERIYQIPLFPCNLPFDLLNDGQEIIFSGKISNWQRSSNDSIVADFFSIPIILTKAKIKDK